MSIYIERSISGQYQKNICISMNNGNTRFPGYENNVVRQLNRFEAKIDVLALKLDFKKSFIKELENEWNEAGVHNQKENGEEIPLKGLRIKLKEHDMKIEVNNNNLIKIDTSLKEMANNFRVLYSQKTGQYKNNTL